MEALESAGSGYIRYKLNGFWGLINTQGKILIDTDRGYTKIGDYVSFTKRFPYEMDGYKGECNNLGKEISRIPVSKPLNNSKVSSLSRSNSSNTSTNTNISESHEEELPDGLLYKGIYTQSTQGRARSTGGYTGVAGPDIELEVEIYEDKMMVNGMEYEYKGTKNGRRMYRGGFNDENTYYVSSSYNMYLETQFSSMFGTEWFTYEVTKGRSLMPKYTPEFGGSGSSSGYKGQSSSGSSNGRSSASGGTRSSSRKVCQACKYGNGRCGVCHGTGKKQSSFAGHTVWVDCDNCHRTGKCPVCGGDGWID